MHSCGIRRYNAVQRKRTSARKLSDVGNSNRAIARQSPPWRESHLLPPANDPATSSAQWKRTSGNPIRIVLQPARRPASTSLSESPAIHDAAKSIPRSCAAASNIPGCGLRHPQGRVGVVWAIVDNVETFFSTRKFLPHAAIAFTPVSATTAIRRTVVSELSNRWRVAISASIVSPTASTNSSRSVHPFVRFEVRVCIGNDAEKIGKRQSCEPSVWTFPRCRRWRSVRALKP